MTQRSLAVLVHFFVGLGLCSSGGCAMIASKLTCVAVVLGALALPALAEPEPHPTGRIAGRVVDEQGSPVPGAQLRAMLSGFVMECGGSYPPGGWVNASTGADGRFTLDSLRPGWFEIEVYGTE